MLETQTNKRTKEMGRKLSIRDVDVFGKRVLMRVDFNVPLKEGVIKDDTRIVEALPTIRNVIDRGGKLILMSHLGRPDGKRSEEFSLMPVATQLSQLLERTVNLAPDCVGSDVVKMVNSLNSEDVLLLENVRFHAEEELLHKYKKQDDETKAKIDKFVKDLASLGDIYVNDAFGTAHRAHASTQGVTKYFNISACGLLMEKEVNYLTKALANPERPFVAILGGAKVSDKIGVITNLLEKVDTLIIGGAMAYTFLKAQGLEVGKSLVEDEMLDTAKGILAKAKDRGVKFMLPIDHVSASGPNASSKEFIGKNIPSDKAGLDIGPETILLYKNAVVSAKTVVWNGPMGVFENPVFSEGTFEIAQALADTDATTIIGGGDSVSAVKKSGVASKISHISTGGGACLEFLEGKELPGVTSLTNA